MNQSSYHLNQQNLELSHRGGWDEWGGHLFRGNVVWGAVFKIVGGPFCSVVLKWREFVDIKVQVGQKPCFSKYFWKKA